MDATNVADGVETGAFVVWEPDNDKVYRVWPDGRIEGFADRAVILNGMLPWADQREAIAWVKGRESASIVRRLRASLARLVAACRKVPSAGSVSSAQ